MRLSIVIPTYNREKILEKTLLMLDKQTIKPPEVIIIDDDSNNESQEYTKRVLRKVRFPVTVISNSPEKGPAAARNKGIKKAKGDYILFIDDDSIPEDKNFIKKHIEFSKKYPESAVIGGLKWHPETPNQCLLGKWTKQLGFDVGYDDMGPDKELPFDKYCTANILVPRNILLKCMFDESFPYAAIEDTEWGYRMKKMGVDLKYNPGACALHYHKYVCEMIGERQSRAGKALAIFIKLHPELYSYYKPVVPKILAKPLKVLVSSPLIKLFPSDIRNFLVGLSEKYYDFWSNYT